MKEIKNLSALKLVKMILLAEHMPYCNNINTKFPVAECICWLHEAKKFEKAILLKNKTRVRKPKPKKVHYDLVKCSAKPPKSSTMFSGDVTCKQCLVLINKKNIFKKNKVDKKLVKIWNI